MLVSAQQVADSLALLVPGFVLVKVFYFFGLQTKRSDAQWVIWSILASAPIAAIASALTPGFGGLATLTVSLLFAVTGGIVLSVAWALVAARRPDFLARELVRAWDVVLSPRQRWLQLELTDGRVFVGKQEYVALSVDTDDLDLFLTDVRQSAEGSLVAIEGVEGLLLRRSEIRFIAVLNDPAPAPQT